MKKTKFLSVFASMAVATSMAVSSMCFGATAETASPVGLKMTSDKTIFTLEEIKSGDAEAVVYVDSTKTFSADENVNYIDFMLKSTEWGSVEPVNLQISATNALGTDKGNKSNHFESMGTIASSIWDEALPEKHPYMLLNYKDQDPDIVYSDDCKPHVIIMGSSSTGVLRAEEANAKNHIAEFDVKFASDLEPGTYTINFNSCYVGVGGFKTGETHERIAITELDPIVFEIVDEENPTGTTEPTEGDDYLRGDANLDKSVDVRDCAAIASALANGKATDLPQKNSDYNLDNEVNVRDAAALATDLANGTVKK